MRVVVSIVWRIQLWVAAGGGTALRAPPYGMMSSFFIFIVSLLHALDRSGGLSNRIILIGTVWAHASLSVTHTSLSVASTFTCALAVLALCCCRQRGETDCKLLLISSDMIQLASLLLGLIASLSASHRANVESFSTPKIIARRHDDVLTISNAPKVHHVESQSNHRRQRTPLYMGEQDEDIADENSLDNILGSVGAISQPVVWVSLFFVATTGGAFQQDHLGSWVQWKDWHISPSLAWSSGE